MAKVESTEPAQPEHVKTPLKTTFGESFLHCFSFGPHEEDNILVIDCIERSISDRHLLRVQSACYTAEIFRSTDCDCHAQLKRSIDAIHSNGGALIYMLADGRGAGLLTKVRGLALGHEEGLDTHDAYERLGVEIDPRSYSRVSTVALALGLSKVTLLTNNPKKVTGLRAGGLDVKLEALEIPATDDSRPYLETKRSKMGHLLKLDG